MLFCFPIVSVEIDMNYTFAKVKCSYIYSKIVKITEYMSQKQPFENTTALIVFVKKIGYTQEGIVVK